MILILYPLFKRLGYGFDWKTVDLLIKKKFNLFKKRTNFKI